MEARSAPGAWSAEIPELLKLAGPMMLAQGGLMTMGMVDTFVVGRVSPLEMGGVALGNSVASLVTVFGVGLALGLEPLASQAHGAGEAARARHWLVQGLWLSAFAAVPLVVLLMVSAQLLPYLGVSEALAERAAVYLYARVPGVFANGLYVAYRAYLSSVGRTRPVLVAVLSANVLNAILDWYLVMELGLGAAGVGVATSFSWFLMLAVAAYAARAAGPITQRPEPPVPADLRRVFGLGWPIGLHFTVEVGIFALVSMLIARLGEVELSGHNIALMLASLTFMAAVGFAVAATARVGHHVGAGDTAWARRTGFLAIALGGAFMGTCGLCFFFFAEPITRLFAPSEPEVVAIGARLLQIAAVFSVCDGVQAVSAGALRGAGDTKWPFYVNTGAHWLIGLPVALWLGYGLGWSTAGFWWGLTAGLTAVAVILLGRFAFLARGSLRRLEDPAPSV